MQKDIAFIFANPYEQGLEQRVLKYLAPHPKILEPLS